MPDSSPAKALVVGATGVIGRYIVERLLQEPTWEAVGLSRRALPARAGYTHLAVDLLDDTATAQALAQVSGITHVFFAGFAPAGGVAADYARNIEVNLKLLQSAVRHAQQTQRGLRRVVLVTGTKYYGVHLGPYKTPAKEDDPRHMPPNYYYDQIDWLLDFHQTCQGQGSTWDWVELRPQTLCGFAPGTAMSIIPVLAVYAALSKAQGLPLRFPGKAEAWRSIYQVTSSAHFAQAAWWAATTPSCANQAFNITNGDYFRWCNVWPRLAEVFDMPWAEPQTIALTQHMPTLRPLWERLVQTHRLTPVAWDDLVAWPFGDYVFGATWDVMSSTVKARQYGFDAVVDSEDMLVELLQQYRQNKIVP